MSIDLKITSILVEAKIREIKANYKREMAHDLSKFHSIDYFDLRRDCRKESINKIFKTT